MFFTWTGVAVISRKRFFSDNPGKTINGLSDFKAADVIKIPTTGMKQMSENKNVFLHLNKIVKVRI